MPNTSLMWTRTTVQNSVFFHVFFNLSSFCVVSFCQHLGTDTYTYLMILIDMTHKIEKKLNNDILQGTSCLYDNRIWWYDITDIYIGMQNCYIWDSNHYMTVCLRALSITFRKIYMLFFAYSIAYLSNLMSQSIAVHVIVCGVTNVF